MMERLSLEDIEKWIEVFENDEDDDSKRILESLREEWRRRTQPEGEGPVYV